MSNQLYDESRESGAPINLFLFTYGPDAADYYGYTTGDAPITVAALGKTFVPAPFSRGEVQTSGNLDNQTLEVRGSLDSDLANLFLVYPPTQVVGLIIYEGQARDVDQEFVAIWTGRVINCSRQGSEAVYSCEPGTTAMKRAGLRRHWQFGCPHALYGTQCGANQAAATSPATVASVDGSTVTLSSGWEPTGIDGQKYIGGMMTWTVGTHTERRSILQVNGDEIVLSGFARDLVATDTVSMVLGCNHQRTDCLTLHNNIQNFGGQSWIPTKNPFANVNRFG